jgi:hypothetical protein
MKWIDNIPTGTTNKTRKGLTGNSFKPFLFYIQVAQNQTENLLILFGSLPSTTETGI